MAICPDRREEDLKHIDEEEERQAQHVGEDEGPEPVPAGVNWWCRCMHCSAAETEIESQCCSELQQALCILEVVGFLLFGHKRPFLHFSPARRHQFEK